MRKTIKYTTEVQGYDTYALKFKIGKKEFYSVDLVDFLVSMLKNAGKPRSKSEVKRLIKNEAIDLIIDAG